MQYVCVLVHGYVDYLDNHQARFFFFIVIRMAIYE